MLCRLTVPDNADLRGAGNRFLTECDWRTCRQIRLSCPLRKPGHPDTLDHHQMKQVTTLLILFSMAFANAADRSAPTTPKASGRSTSLRMPATSFPITGSGYYVNRNWLAINPNTHKRAKTSAPFPFPSGRYDLTLHAVGEEDGRANYEVRVNDTSVGKFECPLSKKQFEEGPRFTTVWRGVELNPGDVIDVISTVASEDGKEFSRARWSALSFSPTDSKPANLSRASAASPAKLRKPKRPPS